MARRTVLRRKPYVAERRYQALAGAAERRRCRWLIWRYFGASPDVQRGWPWWWERYAVEGLRWQADDGDGWPDEQVFAGGSLDELAEAGVTVRRRR